MKPLYAFACLILFLYAGCKDDPGGPGTPPDVPSGGTAVYVLNEGDFSDATGARLTRYDVATDSVYRDVFESANGGAHLGNVGDDMLFYNGRAYIAMSGSKNIVVMNLANHQSETEAAFPGSAVNSLLIDSVRSKIFVTRLFSGSVFVLDLATLVILDSITVGANPQGMVLAGGKVFICNSGYGFDNTVTVADAATHQVLTTLTLADGPAGAAVASDGNVWITCTGNAFGAPATAGRVFVLDPVTYTKMDSVSFAGNLWGSMVIGSDGYAYILGTTTGSFFGGPVHRISVSTKSPDMDFIPGTYYGLAFDDVAREVYVSDVMDFSGNAEVKIHTAAGVLRKQFTAQKGASVFAFKR